VAILEETMHTGGARIAALPQPYKVEESNLMAVRHVPKLV
jgi:hypothetical protein